MLLYLTTEIKAIALPLFDHVRDIFSRTRCRQPLVHQIQTQGVVGSIDEHPEGSGFPQDVQRHRIVSHADAGAVTLNPCQGDPGHVHAIGHHLRGDASAPAGIADIIPELFQDPLDPK
jgi:hypothetical protein